MILVLVYITIYWLCQKPRYTFRISWGAQLVPWGFLCEWGGTKGSHRSPPRRCRAGTSCFQAAGPIKLQSSSYTWQGPRQRSKPNNFPSSCAVQPADRGEQMSSCTSCSGLLLICSWGYRGRECLPNCFPVIGLSGTAQTSVTANIGGHISIKEVCMWLNASHERDCNLFWRAARSTPHTNWML